MRPALLLAAALAGVAGRGAAQTGAATRGATLGGVIGAAAVGLLGAVLGAGVCDAACSGAWLDGAIPGAVLGGLGGAAVGGAIGALAPRERRAATRPVRPVRPALAIEGSASRGESESVDQNLIGARALAGLRRGGLLVGPAIERHAGSRWRATGLMLTVRLDPGTATVRPFAELSAGRVSWRHPGVLADCRPGVPPDCTYREGTIRDAYLGAAGAVGVALVDGAGRWSAFAQLRYHHSGSRPTGEPGSTVTRQLAQVGLGVELTPGGR